jgi:hypothetical protein
MLSLIGDRPRRRRSSIPLPPQSSAMIPSVMTATIESKKQQHLRGKAGDAVEASCPSVIEQAEHHFCYIPEWEICPIFSVGQRVRFSDIVGKRSWWFRPGQTGTIIRMDAPGALPIDIEVDGADGGIAHVSASMIDPAA